MSRYRGAELLRLISISKLREIRKKQLEPIITLPTKFKTNYCTGRASRKAAFDKEAKKS